MIFNYKAITSTGQETQGTIEAFNVDIAINTLQKKGLVISQIHMQEDAPGNFPLMISLFNGVSNKDIVILSRQMSTLFSAKVPALRIFRLLGNQIDNAVLRKYLTAIADDIQGGSPISVAMSKYPDAFSSFYVNMVRSGEESGKLEDIFIYLADYMDRTYEVTSKAKSALIYPAFVVFTFISVMILMLTVIIPKIALMITDSGQQVPIYTQIVLWISKLFTDYGLYMGVTLVVAGFFTWRYSRTDEGGLYFDTLKLELPYIGDLYKKLYLSRIADNLHTMIISGIPILRALDITSSVVDNRVYKKILDDTLMRVREGTSLSDALSLHKEIPNLLTQMTKVGEETGELGNILNSLAKFYEREVSTAVDTLVSLIEPVMIVGLGLGVGILLSAVLMPIYNIAAGTA